MGNRSDLVNYADDNTVTTIQPTYNLVVEVLQDDSRVAIEWFTSNCMLANPDKFQAIYLNCPVENINLHINSKIIQPDKDVKLLGVILDNNLNFEAHIKHVCKKAGNHLNVLKRLSSFLDRDSRMRIFRCFILCHFQFCCAVWHFCGKGSTQKMEKIQERALRFVYGDYTTSYPGLLCKARLPSLELGRERDIAILTYKIINKLAPAYLNELLTPHPNLNSKLLLPSFKSSKHGLNSFTYKAPRIWNNLSEEMRTAISLSSFVSLTNTWWGKRKAGHACEYCRVR